jgi:hypothetical protein
MNWIQILIAAIVSMIIGALWHGPIFGKMWMRLHGFTKKDIEKAKKDPKIAKQMRTSYILTFLGQILTAAVFSFLLDQIGVTSSLHGAFVGFLFWLGFIVTTVIGGVLWEKQSWSQYLFSIAYFLVQFIVMGAILAF